MPASISYTTVLSLIIPKKNETAIFLSTMHRTAPIEQDTMKSEVIQFYNKTKGMWTHWTSTVTHILYQEKLDAH
jgi:hypothetical protein